MKKQYIKVYLAAFSLLLFMQFSCQKWLDVRPGAEVVAKDLFKDENGFIEALNGVYLRMGAGLYGDNMTLGVWSSLIQDYAIYDTQHPYYELSRFNFSNSNVKRNVDGIWANMYKAIAEVNVILEYVDAQKGVFTRSNYERVKGEALGLRALLHFDLLRMFGPVPLGNKEGISIPYKMVLSKEVAPMLTLNEVVKHCLTDLEEAEKLLAMDKGVYYQRPELFEGYTRNHFNYWATLALQARIYMYIDEKPNALKYAKQVIDAAPFPFVDRENLTRGGNKDLTFSSEHIFAIYAPKITTYIDRHFRPDRIQDYGSISFYGISYDIDDEFEVGSIGSTDYRWLYHFNYYGRIAYSNKFYQDNLTQMHLRNQMPVIRLSEMYYIAAEATQDPVVSVAYLNKVREHRGLPDYGGDWGTKSKHEEILKEYTKEFYAEGQHYFFYKRLGIYVSANPYKTLKKEAFRFPYPTDELEFGNHN